MLVAINAAAPIVEAAGVADKYEMAMLNVTNTPPLGAPATVAGAPGFGSITSAGDPRVLQFGLKVNF